MDSSTASQGRTAATRAGAAAVGSPCSSSCSSRSRASALLGLGPGGGLAWVAYLAGGALLGLGVALLVAGGAGLGSALTPFPAPRGGEALRTSGVYGLVRHPIYGGVILVALGWSIAFATPVGLALTVVLALFFELKSRREEHLLEQIHPDYPEYRRHTRRRFLPYGGELSRGRSFDHRRQLRPDFGCDRRRGHRSRRPRASARRRSPRHGSRRRACRRPRCRGAGSRGQGRRRGRGGRAGGCRRRGSCTAPRRRRASSFSVACTSISQRTPKPSAASSSRTRSTASSKPSVVVVVSV